jgi:hypothetical protein
VRTHELEYLRGVATLIAGMFLMAAGQSSVAAQSAGLDGGVHRGTCDRLAESVSDSTPFFFGIGEHRGNNQAIPAASSFATIPIPFDAMLADDHSVTASDAAGDVVACGEIAGTRTDDGALIVGLRAENESAVTGVAYLSPSDDASQTDVTLMVAGEPLAEMANAQARDAVAYANDLVRITDSTRESFRAFVMLMGDTRFGQDDWTNEVKAQLDIWDSNYEEALTLNPPPVFAETHALLLEALRIYGDAGDDAALGLDTLDPAMINQAASKVAKANESFIQVVEEVDRIRQERDE